MESQVKEQKINGHAHNDYLKESSDMATTRQEEKLDELSKSILILSTELTRKVGQYELELAQSREVLHRLANSLEKNNSNNGRTNDWLKYGISLALVIIGWVFSGFVVIKNTESELKLSNAVRDERDKNLLQAFEEFKKTMTMRMDLLDERYRQQSIDMKALERRGR